MFFAMIGQFFISEWLWSVTWGISHNIINILLMLFLCKFFLRIPIISAVLLSFFAQLFAFSLYTAFVVGVLMFVFGLEYDVTASSMLLPGPLYACLFLGVIYAFLQMIFFFLIRFYYKIPCIRISVMSLISNLLTALLVYITLSY